MSLIRPDRPCRRRQVLLAALLGTAAACGGGGVDAVRFTERDSAGVRIAANSGPGWSAAEPGWRVLSEPMLEIGTFDGPPEYQLDQVRGVTRLADGRVAVAVGATREIRFFGADGSFLGRSGRQGGGPGEFEGLGGMWRLPGDTLVAWDFQLRRASRFDPQGGFLGAVTIEPSERLTFPVMLGAFDDGSLLLHVGAVTTFESQPGTRRDSTVVVRYHPDGSLARDYGTFPSWDRVVVFSGSREGRPTSVTTATVPFGRRSSFLAAGRLLWVATADRWELAGYDPDGNLVRLVRRELPREPLQRAEVDSFIAAELARLRDQNPEWAERQREVYEATTFPALKPAHGQVRIGTDGSFWVEGERTGEWAVLTPQGRFLGVVGMPQRFQLHEAGADYVLGLWHDDLDVTYVRVYPLVR